MKLPNEIQLLPIGRINTSKYGEVDLNDAVLDSMVDEFSKVKASNRPRLPMDEEHDHKKATGWIKDVRKTAKGLFAKVDWSKVGQELLGGGAYDSISADFDMKLDAEGNGIWGKLKAAGLTNHPVFKNDVLRPILASENAKRSDGLRYISKLKINNNNMSKQEIIASEEEEKKEEEVVEEKPTEAVEEKVVEASEEEKVEEKVEEEVEEKEEEEKEEPKEEEKAVEASEDEKTITVKASEYKGIKEHVEEMEKKIKASEVEKEVASFLCSEKEEAGKVLPKGKDALSTFLMSASKEQKANLKEILESVALENITGEKGISSKSVEASEEKNQEEAVKRAKENGTTAREEIVKILKEQGGK